MEEKRKMKREEERVTETERERAKREREREKRESVKCNSILWHDLSPHECVGMVKCT